MTAFFIAQVIVKDEEKFKEYGAKAGEIVKGFGGEVVVRGKFETVLHGDVAAHQAVGVISFPDIETLQSFYASDAYQAIIPLRDEAADMNFTVYQQPAV